MTIVFGVIVILVLLSIFKGPSKRGKWEQEQLFYGLQDFLKWQLDLCFITFAVRDYANFAVEDDDNKLFLKKCTTQALNDIINKRLTSEFISNYITGAALRGAYILGGPSHMGARILASITIEKLLGLKVAQEIYDLQNEYQSSDADIYMGGAAAFTDFYKWQKSGIQNEHYSAGPIVDHLVLEHAEYLVNVMKNINAVDCN